VIPVLGLAILAWLCTGVALRAQTPPPQSASAGDSGTAGQPAAKGVIPLAHYVPRDNLIFYAEFSGLDAHTDAWKKTAAQRMLNDTPLGAMLEDVAAQLLDKALSSAPNRKLSGAELVSLIKAAGHNGWALAFGAGQKGKIPFFGVLVIRGIASKEMRPLTSRLLGMMMGPDAKPKIERKAGRVLVVVPEPNIPDAGLVWWPENNDLVIGFAQPSDADTILGVLDGKAPSAADHAVLNDLAKPDANFQPVMRVIVDPGAVPSEPQIKMTEFFEQLKSSTGLRRIDYRWGFDDDGLMSVLRLVAPAPRKSLLAVFDQPPVDAKQIIPMPEGVESFMLLSLSPAKLIEALSQVGPAGQLKGKLDELMEKVKSQNRIDFNKDVFNNLGPKMVVYLAPGRSAAAIDETPPAAPATAGGFDPAAMLSSLQGSLPKPTLVAELRDPTAFGKALDAVMVAINRELKAQAIEKAAEEASAAAANPAPAGGGAQAVAPGRMRRGGGGEGTGERPARKRSARETPAPEFQLMPGQVKTYMLKVPTESSLKILPQGVRPTIRMEGHYVAISSSAESARVALEVTRKKGWKPSADIEQALAHVPSGMVLLAVGDPRETDPPMLASLPATLQAQINSIIAMSSGAAGGTAPGTAAPGQGGFPGANQPPSGYPGMAGGGPGGPGGGRFGRGRSGGGGQEGEPGGSGGQGQFAGRPGGMPAGYAAMMGRGGSGGMAAAAPGAQTAGAPADAMIQLKIDPAKLPKAEELKALMFPGTWAVAVDDQSIRLVTREAFPSLMGTSGSAVAASVLLPAINAARARAQAAAAGAAPPGQPGIAGQPPAVAPPASLPAAPARGGSPGGPGRRGGRGRAEPD
jgi:hypothetical protein